MYGSVWPARAEWTAHADGPDVFGTTKVVAVTDGPRQSLIVQCDDKDQLFLAFIFAKKEFDNVPTVPANLLIQTDGGTPVHLMAEIREWNDNYAGVVVEGRTPELVNVLQSIHDAHLHINIGIAVGDNRQSASFEADGSTAAIDEVFSGCKLRAGKTNAS
jgi:hypothetical protein